MRYNQTLFKSLGKKCTHTNGVTDVAGLFRSAENLYSGGNFDKKVFLNVENSLYQIGGFDIHEMEIDGETERVVCIAARIPEWLKEYDAMNTQQLIEELGRQSTRRATAMYGSNRVDFITRSDADDRISYINDCLMKLRFGNRTKEI